MNTSILTKCLEELQKDVPRKDYVVGMLETLIEMNSTPPHNPSYPTVRSIPTSTESPFPQRPIEPLTEQEKLVLQAYGAGPIGEVSNI